MAKIIDPSLLRRATTSACSDGHVFFDTANSLIYIRQYDGSAVPEDDTEDPYTGNFGNLTMDGLSMQCLYSYAKEEWKNDAALPAYPFPFVSITEESFELVDGWDFDSDTARNLIRDGGWAVKHSNGNSISEYANFTSLGAFDDSATDQAYYVQSVGGAVANTIQAGEVNEAIQIYSDINADGTADFDYRDHFEMFLREQGKVFAYYDLLTAQNISALTYKKYALPLANSNDLKVTTADVGIDANSDSTPDVAPYSGMSITWGAVTRNIGGVNYDFSVVIEANNGTKEEVYEFVQWALRQTGDIDAGAGNKIGQITEELLEFVGDTLKTKYTTYGGVYIDNLNATDLNSVTYQDDTDTTRSNPYVAAGEIVFNDNLLNDGNAIYKMYFTNANGNQFGTATAIVVDDNSGADIAGAVPGSGTVSFTFDYDGNEQGGRTGGTDADVTVVAIGLTTAQYVKATGTLKRSNANVISLVSALERNYSSPV